MPLFSVLWNEGFFYARSGQNITLSSTLVSQPKTVPQKKAFCATKLKDQP